MTLEGRDRAAARGYAAAGLIVFIWTGFILTSRWGVQRSLGPLDLAALRFAIAGALLLPWVVRRGLAGLRLGQAVVLMATAGPPYALLVYYGFVFAPAAHGGVVIPGALPIFAVLLTWLVTRQAPSRPALLGYALILAGIFALAAARSGGGSAAWVGDLMFAGADFSWAIYTVLVHRWRVAAVDATALVAVLSAVAFLPFYLLAGPSRLLAAPFDELVLQIVYQGLLATVVAGIVVTTAIQSIGPAKTTTITALVPVTTTVAAIPVLGEVPIPLEWLGCLLVPAGIVLSLGLRPRRARARPLQNS